MSRQGMRWSLCLALMLMASCGRKASQSSASTTSTSARIDSVATIAAYRQATRIGPPVGKRDSLMNEIAPKLAPWIAMLRAGLPGYETDSLQLRGSVEAMRIDGPHEYASQQAPVESEAAAEILGIASPNGSYLLVADRYTDVSESDSSASYGYDVDSGPILLEPRRRLAFDFDVVATDRWYNWGCWIDDDRFALTGWQHEDAGGNRAIVHIYSLADSSSRVYVTRYVTAGEFEKCHSQWDSWAAGRYRAWKARQPRPSTSH
jgi:hypothetical protein